MAGVASYYRWSLHQAQPQSNNQQQAINNETRKAATSVEKITGGSVTDFNNIKAHANSLTYKYGDVMRFDTYGLIMACKGSDYIQVLMFRNQNETMGPKPPSPYYIPYVDVYWQNGFNPQNGHFGSKYNRSWLYGIISLTRVGTRASMANWVNVPGTRFGVTSSNSGSRILNLVHSGAPRSEYWGEYVRAGSLSYPTTRYLRHCH